MSGVVLAVGALMLAVGGYEMFVGNGNILSERGWSAFIAGAVLLAGGVVTMALGLAVRALDRLRVAVLHERPAPTQFAPSLEATTPVSAAAPQPDLFDEPAFEPAPTAPVLAALPIEHEPHSAIAAPAPTPAAPPEPAGVEPRHDDWLDHSFVELEREMASRYEPPETAPPVRPDPVTLAAEPASVAPPEPPPEPVDEPRPARAAVGESPIGTSLHEAPAPQAAELTSEPEPHAPATDQATVSAREATAPAASAVIGRYESEGTSYVMYADGSIDAQSEAGVYRFASMAELKTFIES